jgi:hypothetical protein
VAEEKIFVGYGLSGMGIELPVAVAGMSSPVRCSLCGKYYDLQAVTPTTSHADCTPFRAPCCGVEADERTWIHQPYVRVSREQLTALRAQLTRRSS